MEKRELIRLVGLLFNKYVKITEKDYYKPSATVIESIDIDIAIIFFCNTKEKEKRPKCNLIINTNIPIAQWPEMFRNGTWEKAEDSNLLQEIIFLRQFGYKKIKFEDIYVVIFNKKTKKEIKTL